MSEALPEASQDTPPTVILHGRVLDTLPKDVYIQPESLNVLLSDFEGPLDLLLYFVRSANIDILDLNLRDLTEQYLNYIEAMKRLKIDVATEYLVMAATLIEYKTRKLSPRQHDALGIDDDQADPRIELAQRLLEYEKIKEASIAIDALPRMDRNTYHANIFYPNFQTKTPEPSVNIRQLFVAAQRVMRQVAKDQLYQVTDTRLSVVERVDLILKALRSNKDFMDFRHLCDTTHGRMGVAVSLVALTELLKDKLIEVVQMKTFGEIQVRARMA